ncbi:hypothetical protein [Synechococcus sp. M16CYN]|uniref:hypothetical protein n=1 Tax=Synechococcus sp. M16CYN TaxID=3103139 RepID=UPI0033425EF0
MLLKLRHTVSAFGLRLDPSGSFPYSPDVGLLRVVTCFEAELHEHRLQLDHQRGRRSPLSQPWRTRPDQGLRDRRSTPSARSPDHV